MWYLRESEHTFGRAHSNSEITQSASFLEETCFQLSLKLSKEVATRNHLLPGFEKIHMNILTQEIEKENIFSQKMK
jgi:hypothetical protein